MPTYVYACDTCGTQFEQFQSFKDEPIHTCPSCAGKVRRVFQPVGIVFKGSGWYITDSRKSSTASVPSEDSSAKSTADNAAKTESKAEPKADTKTETKSDAASTPKSETKTSAPATAD